MLEKILLSTEWRDCLFSFNMGWGSRRIERRKGAKDFFLCRNVACHLTSVEQSFLIKTEGFGWTRVTFHSRQLKSWETLQISSSRQHSLRQMVPLFHSSLSTLFQAWTKPRQITWNRHEKSLTLKESVGVRRYHLYSCYLRTCPKLAPKL